MKIKGQIYYGKYFEKQNGTRVIYYGRDLSDIQKNWTLNRTPYFFASNKPQKVFESVRNLERIKTLHPKDVRNIRNKYVSTYEADIPFTRRILIDELEDELFKI